MSIGKFPTSFKSNEQYQKISILPPPPPSTGGIGISWGYWGSGEGGGKVGEGPVRQKNIQCDKLIFPEGAVLEKK